MYLFGSASLLSKWNSNYLTWQKVPFGWTKPSILGIDFLLAPHYSVISRQTLDFHNSKILFKLLLLLESMLSLWFCWNLCSHSDLLNLQRPASWQIAFSNLFVPYPRPPDRCWRGSHCQCICFITRQWAPWGQGLCYWFISDPGPSAVPGR